MHLHSYLHSSAQILEGYKGEMAFSAHLKNHFAANKKFGSRDRKQIAQLCYSYFRLGKSFETHSIEDQLLAGQFLVSTGTNPYLEQFRPEWNKVVKKPVREKFDVVNGDVNKLFPFAAELSDAVDRESFAFSILSQPDLFVRIRPGYEDVVEKKLTAAGISFIRETESALRLPNTTGVQEMLLLNREVVVQDLSSQQVLNAFFNERITPIKAWDCCAASGGKSILLHDHFPKTKLIVTDIRESILANLKKRFLEAGIKNFEAYKADLSKEKFRYGKNLDLVICDVPCSGSGTWSRTPEQVRFFSPGKIEYYAQLQKSIAIHAAASVTEGGYLSYITCSVFQKENEMVVKHLLENTDLKLISQHYLTGYDKKADTMFTALFRL